MLPASRIAWLLLLAAALNAEEYVLGPDSSRQPGVPHGRVTRHVWRSRIYAGTVRDYWIYVPAQYRPDKPACTMVFQDGATFVNESGAFRTTIVFDNLIAKGDMPVTIGVFVSPGVVEPMDGDASQPRFNRSYEYDSAGPRFAQFLAEEILPEVGKSYNLSANPQDRAISGSSSGGNASFNAAFNRPDVFGRVLSFIGGFTNLRGDHILPSMVRKQETRPIRVFLQDGLEDVNVYSNYELALALKHAGYDHKLVIGTEGHNSKHGSAILPDALRWLWRDHGKPIPKPVDGVRHFLTNSVLYPDKDWELVSQGHGFTEGPAVDRAGNVYFSDIPNNRIHKISLDGTVSVFQTDTGGANGLMFGPDGRLYACQSDRKRVVAYSMDGMETVIADGVAANDLAVNAKGDIYFTEPAARRVWFVQKSGTKRVVHEGIALPNGIVLSPDQSILMVADTLGRSVWSFSIQSDGSLANGTAFHRLEMPDEVESSGILLSGADGMTIDSEGFLYVATKLGVQINDPAGRTVGIFRKPANADPSNLVFGGSDLQTLYMTAGDKVFKRSIKRKGVVSWTVTKPPKPRL